MIEEWPPLSCYFDKVSNDASASASERAKIIDKKLKDQLVKLLCHFVLYALMPLKVFSTAFQTHVSLIGSLHHDVYQLLRKFMSNFIDPEVIKSADT